MHPNGHFHVLRHICNSALSVLASFISSGRNSDLRLPRCYSVPSVEHDAAVGLTRLAAVRVMEWRALECKRGCASGPCASLILA